MEIVRAIVACLRNVAPRLAHQLGGREWPLVANCSLCLGVCLIPFCSSGEGSNMEKLFQFVIQWHCPIVAMERGAMVHFR